MSELAGEGSQLGEPIAFDRNRHIGRLETRAQQVEVVGPLRSVLVAPIGYVSEPARVPM